MNFFIQHTVCDAALKCTASSMQAPWNRTLPQHWSLDGHWFLDGNVATVGNRGSVHDWRKFWSNPRPADPREVHTVLLFVDFEDVSRKKNSHQIVYKDKDKIPKVTLFLHFLQAKRCSVLCAQLSLPLLNCRSEQLS